MLVTMAALAAGRGLPLGSVPRPQWRRRSAGSGASPPPRPGRRRRCRRCGAALFNASEAEADDPDQGAVVAGDQGAAREPGRRRDVGEDAARSAGGAALAQGGRLTMPAKMPMPQLITLPSASTHWPGRTRTVARRERDQGQPRSIRRSARSRSGARPTIAARCRSLAGMDDPDLGCARRARDRPSRSAHVRRSPRRSPRPPARRSRRSATRCAPPSRTRS